MKVVADTNVLVRAVVDDDPKQAALARRCLGKASLVAVSTTTLCEFVWVLRKGYRVPASDIAAAIRGLTASANVVAHLPAVEAGLAILDAGGDFADGVIAFDGCELGGEVFVSFDQQAVAKLTKQGVESKLLSGAR